MPVPVRPSRALAARRFLGRLALIGVPAVYVIAVITTPAGLADQVDARTAHSPIGAVVSVGALADGSVRLTGWAADIDVARGRPLTEYGIVDGQIRSRTAAIVARRGAHARFALTVPVPAGEHTVCVAVQNVGIGLSTLLRCVSATTSVSAGMSVQTRYDPHRSAAYNARYNTVTSTQLTTRIVTTVRDPKAAEVAAHSPRGALSAVRVNGTTVRVTGYSADPDFLGRRLVGSVSIDGTPTMSFVTTAATAAQRKHGAGRLGAFDVRASIGYGTHTVCISLDNVGPGADVRLPCTSVYLAAPLAPFDTTLRVPATGVNAAVVAEALRHLGQRYVWATQGPDTFDCSGLVMYSYAKAGIAVPRIAADQAAAAHPISAADARPGDLVFYHDSTGYVYHVGIYLAPGRSVAAIDPAEGVNYQAITDPSATYGSFTHT